MEDVLHIGIVLIVGIVEFNKLPVVLLFVGLVKNTEHLFQSVVDLSVQEWNLHDDAVMDKAVDKRVRKTLGNLVTLVIVGFMIDIEHRHIDMPYPMPENIYCHHRNPIGRAHLFAHHILGIGILCAEVLPET